MCYLDPASPTSSWATCQLWWVAKSKRHILIPQYQWFYAFIRPKLPTENALGTGRTKTFLSIEQELNESNPWSNRLNINSIGIWSIYWEWKLELQIVISLTRLPFNHRLSAIIFHILVYSTPPVEGVEEGNGLVVRKYIWNCTCTFM